MVVDLNSKQVPDRKPVQTKLMNGVTVTDSIRGDSWSNALIGLGKRNVDKTMSTMYGEMPDFTDDELSNLYAGEGLGKRIIDLRPKDATRAWIDIPSDPEEVIIKELERLGAKTAFKKALSWARLYRGAIIVIVEKGARDLAKPLPKDVKKIQNLRVYSAARIDLSYSDIVTKASSPYFDEVEWFPVRLKNGTPQKIHASRCLVFKGEEGPDEGVLDFKYKYWGLPVMKQIYDRLRGFGAVEQSVVNLLLEFNVGKYTLANLTQMLSSNDEATLNLIYDRMDIINASKSMINAVLLGEGESYDRDSAALGGLSDVLDRLMIFLSAVAGYPVTRLWGRSPAGENATGAFDMRQYYDDVASDQETTLKMPLQHLVNVIGGYTSIAEPTIKFNPLWQPTAKEEAEVYELNSKGDKVYLENGVLSPDQVSIMRFPRKHSTKGAVI